MGTQTQKQRKCCYHNLNAKQLIAASLTGRSLIVNNMSVVGTFY
jgi:hypothetical protein